MRKKVHLNRKSKMDTINNRPTQFLYHLRFLFPLYAISSFFSHGTFIPNRALVTFPDTFKPYSLIFCQTHEYKLIIAVEYKVPLIPKMVSTMIYPQPFDDSLNAHASVRLSIERRYQKHD